MLSQTFFSIDACTLWAYLSAARYFHVSRKVVDDQGHVKMGFEQVLAVIATLPQKGKNEAHHHFARCRRGAFAISVGPNNGSSLPQDGVNNPGQPSP
jgi:hypothetical protein